MRHGKQFGRAVGKIDVLGSQKLELLDDHRRLEHQWATVRVEEELHEARDMESTKAVAEAKVELSNSKEAFFVLECRASTNTSMLRRAIEKRD